MVGFGNLFDKVPDKDEVIRTYKKNLEDATTYLSPDGAVKHYKETEPYVWTEKADPSKIKRAQALFEKQAVTRLIPDTKAEVARMLEEATYVTPDGINAGIVTKQQGKVKE